VIGGGQLAVSASVFNWRTVGESHVPALVYLPLPLLLWAAVRFGPAGVNASLSVVAVLSISGAVHGRGPFTTGTTSDNVLSLQMFLIALSVPLMFLAAVMPYWSSHLPDAESEKIVSSHHNAQRHPDAFEEVHRILTLHSKSEPP
jgi:integral membrane sensor domain MASE1